jgi:hypothetical protein
MGTSLYIKRFKHCLALAFEAEEDYAAKRMNLAKGPKGRRALDEVLLGSAENVYYSSVISIFVATLALSLSM